MSRKVTGSIPVEMMGGPGEVPVTPDDQQSLFDAENGGCSEAGGQVSQENSEDGGEAMPAPTYASPAFALTGDVQNKGAGRPAGSKNKRDIQMVELVERMHGNPLMALGSYYSKDPVQLYLELRERSREHGLTLKLTVKDCVEICIKAAMAALPYMQKKKPVDIAVQGDTQAFFQINIGSQVVNLSQGEAMSMAAGELIEHTELDEAIFDALPDAEKAQ